jgi:hypothetical protein
MVSKETRASRSSVAVEEREGDAARRGAPLPHVKARQI